MSHTFQFSDILILCINTNALPLETVPARLGMISSAGQCYDKASWRGTSSVRHVSPVSASELEPNPCCPRVAAVPAKYGVQSVRFMDQSQKRVTAISRLRSCIPPVFLCLPVRFFCRHKKSNYKSTCHVCMMNQCH